MLFFRVFQHLLPRSQAWNLTIDRTLRRLFVGLTGVFDTARDYVDEVWSDLMPATTGAGAPSGNTTALVEFENQFGLNPENKSELERRQALEAAWAAQGGQDPLYIQGILRTAGFDVYVHEWWSSGPTPPLDGTDPAYVARDPRDYTEIPLVGTVQCSEYPSQPQCSEFADNQPQCNEFLANDPKYIVNLDLTPRAPPPVPNDPDRWRFFWYVAGPTIDVPGYVAVARKSEFQRLIQKHKPTQQWVVLNVIYEPPLNQLVTEGGDPIITQGGDNIVVAA